MNTLQKLSMAQIKLVVKDYNLKHRIPFSRVVDGKRKGLTRKELIAELEKHVYVDDNRMIKRKNESFYQMPLSDAKKEHKKLVKILEKAEDKIDDKMVKEEVKKEAEEQSAELKMLVKKSKPTRNLFKESEKNENKMKEDEPKYMKNQNKMIEDEPKFIRKELKRIEDKHMKMIKDEQEEFKKKNQLMKINNSAERIRKYNKRLEEAVAKKEVKNKKSEIEEGNEEYVNSYNYYVIHPEEIADIDRKVRNHYYYMWYKLKLPLTTELKKYRNLNKK
jgi:hypothetical protein